LRPPLSPNPSASAGAAQDLAEKKSSPPPLSPPAADSVCINVPPSKP